jgi:hypothetical protein
MKRLVYIFIAVSILSGLSACTSYNYYTAAINKTNLSAYHTFAWIPNASNGDKRMNSDVADAKIREAATMALQQKGLRLSQSRPDLVVSYMTKVGTGTKTDYYYGGFYPGWGGWGPGWGVGFGWGGWGWRGAWGWGYPYYGYGTYAAEYADKEHYKEGTLIIDLVDTRTHKIVWRGFGVGEVHHNPQKTIDDLPKVVDGVLAQLQLSQVPARRY